MAEMNIVQRAISNLLAPAVTQSVAQAMSAALDPLRAKIAALEQRPAFTDADRTALAKASQMVAQFEVAAAAQFDGSAAPAPAPADAPVTVEDVPNPNGGTQ